MGVYAYFQKLRLSTFKEWNTKIFELQHISRKYWRRTISGGWVLSSNLVARSTQSCRKTKTSGWQLASRCLSAPMSIFILTSRIFNSQEFPKLSLHKSVLFISLNSPVFFPFAAVRQRMWNICSQHGQAACINGPFPPYMLTQLWCFPQQVWDKVILNKSPRSAPPLSHSGLEWEGREMGKLGQVAMCVSLILSAVTTSAPTSIHQLPNFCLMCN